MTYDNSMPALRQPCDGSMPLVGGRLLRRLRQNFLAYLLEKVKLLRATASSVQVTITVTGPSGEPVETTENRPE